MDTTLNQVLMKPEVRVGADLAAWLALGGGEAVSYTHLTLPTTERV